VPRLTDWSKGPISGLTLKLLVYLPQVLLQRSEEVVPGYQGVAAAVRAVRTQQVVAVPRGLRSSADAVQELQVGYKEVR